MSAEKMNESDGIGVSDSLMKTIQDEELTKLEADVAAVKLEDDILKIQIRTVQQKRREIEAAEKAVKYEAYTDEEKAADAAEQKRLEALYKEFYVHKLNIPRVTKATEDLAATQQELCASLPARQKEYRGLIAKFEQLTNDPKKLALDAKRQKEKEELEQLKNSLDEALKKEAELKVELDSIKSSNEQEILKVKDAIAEMDRKIDNAPKIKADDETTRSRLQAEISELEAKLKSLGKDSDDASVISKTFAYPTNTKEVEKIEADDIAGLFKDPNCIGKLKSGISSGKVQKTPTAKPVPSPKSKRQTRQTNMHKQRMPNSNRKLPPSPLAMFPPPKSPVGRNNLASSPLAVETVTKVDEPTNKMNVDKESLEPQVEDAAEKSQAHVEGKETVETVEEMENLIAEKVDGAVELDKSWSNDMNLSGFESDKSKEDGSSDMSMNLEGEGTKTADDTFDPFNGDGKNSENFFDQQSLNEADDDGFF